MIIEWLLDFIQAGMEWCTSLFPAADVLGFDVFDDVDGIAAYLGDMNYFLPIAETVTIVLAVMALFPIFLGVTLALWVTAQLRGSSSVG